RAAACPVLHVGIGARKIEARKLSPCSEFRLARIVRTTWAVILPCSEHEPGDRYAYVVDLVAGGWCRRRVRPCQPAPSRCSTESSWTIRRLAMETAISSTDRPVRSAAALTKMRRAKNE